MNFGKIFFLCCVFFIGSLGVAKGKSWPEKSLFHLDSQWQDHSAKKVQLTHLSGKMSLVAMVYTTCKHTCPMIISKMISIQNKIPVRHRKNINMTLISFDPGRDTPQHLNKYRAKRKLSQEWVLLTGTPNGTRSLAAILGVNYKEEENGDFSHSNIISLVNQDGVVVSQITNLRQSTDEVVSEMLKNIKTIRR